ncbi:hypothetical protein GC093_32380 [Paenibacillus sp. LMG 31456]|uniref:Uncharacterized protein n=1 Tax=Paenibacillus foliorum TaxID=2654974 RepID=A0A972H0B7_9BACL|nr:hypothetical protein [Paenibacillus foliorum]NOU97889.1 hypothetical protein [Paenibacillus foliorum]
MDDLARDLLGISRSFSVKLILSLSMIISIAFGVTVYYTYQNNLKLFEQEINKQFAGTNPGYS